jgi:hypothetical protein
VHRIVASLPLFAAALVAAAALAPSAWADPPRRDRYRAELELGPVWQTRNDVRIPGNTGTEFALDDLAGAGPYLGGRVVIDWNAWRRHGLRLTVAPSAFEEVGRLTRPTVFAGGMYAPGVDTTGTWKFNTYRLTWRYWLPHSCRWQSNVGLTVLVRDAKIELRQGATNTRKTDLGVVPLLHLDTEFRLAPRLSLVADLDAAWAPQGRAVDFALKLRYRLNRRWDVSFGYRTVEGGADNDEVFNFAWLHQAVLSVGFGI